MLNCRFFLHRNSQEVDKTKGLILQLERESQKRSLLQNDQSVLSAEMVVLRSRERQLQRELEAARDVARSLEEELHKLRTIKSVDDLQMRELQDQLEAEQYFSTLYKTQVTELREEVDEKTKQVLFGLICLPITKPNNSTNDLCF